MATLDIYLWVQPILQIVVGGGITTAIIWYVKWYITTLKDAIQAQEKTIAAQAEQMKSQSGSLKGLETLINTMKTVLESTDEPKMLERLKAYKAMVDEEQQLMVRRVEQSQNELVKEVSSTTVSTVVPQIIEMMIPQVVEVVVPQFVKTLMGLQEFAFKVIPFLPPAQRRAVLDSVDIPPLHGLDIKDSLLRVADYAPVLTGFEPPRWGTIGELTAMGLQAKRERPASGDDTR